MAGGRWRSGVWRQPIHPLQWIVMEESSFFFNRSSPNLSVLLSPSLSLSLSLSKFYLSARGHLTNESSARSARISLAGNCDRFLHTYRIPRGRSANSWHSACKSSVPTVEKTRGFRRVPAGQGSGRETKTTKTKRARQEVPPAGSWPESPPGMRTILVSSISFPRFPLTRCVFDGWLSIKRFPLSVAASVPLASRKRKFQRRLKGRTFVVGFAVYFFGRRVVSG